MPKTIEQYLVAACRASDAGQEKIALYAPALTNATRSRKTGRTTLTFKVVVQEFTPDDVIRNGGLSAFLIVANTDALEALPVPPELAGQAQAEETT